MTAPQALVAAATSGDRDAFVAILRTHDRRLRALASRLLGGNRDQMDDALQDAYVRAYQALPAFRRDADVGTWLYRITYNTCIDHIRRAQRRPHPVDTGDARWDAQLPVRGPEAGVAAADVAQRALAALPPDQRATVLLVDGEGFDNQTAASILGVAVGTVASRLSRARAEVRRLIGEDYA